MSENARKVVLLSAKAVVAAGLLVLVFRRVHWQDFLETIKHARPDLLGWGMAGFLVSLLVVAVRWWYLLRTQEIRIGLWEVVRLTFLGQFFNVVLPGTVGGDALKAYYAVKHTTEKGAVLVTVFVDRLMGLLELAMLGGCMIVVVWAAGWKGSDLMGWPLTKGFGPATTVLIALVVVGVMMLFLLSRRTRSFFNIRRFYKYLPFASQINSAGTAARRFRNRPWVLVAATVMTIAAHVSWIGGIVAIGLGLGLKVEWYSYFVYIPLIYIIGAIPITPGGVGLVEQFYLHFFVSPLVPASSVVALALVVRLFDIGRGLPGLVVSLTGAKVPKADVVNAELGLQDDRNPSAK